MRDWNRDIEKYKKGEMTPAEMHALEKQALYDPFLADALEGLDQVSAEVFSKDLAQLSSAAQLQKKDSTWVWPLRIAAGVAVAIVGYWIFVTQSTLEQKPNLAVQKNEAVNAIPEPAPIANDSASNAAPNRPDQNLAPNKPAKKEEPRVASKTELEQTKTEQAEAGATQQAEAAGEEASAMKVAAAPPVSQSEIKEESVAAESKDARKFKLDESVTRAKRRELAEAPSTLPAEALRSNLANQVITGKVVSADDGTPLPGANVVIIGTSVGTVTDGNGNYELQSPVARPALTFSFIGLKTKQLQAKDAKVDVSLEEDTAQLSELVVVGNGVARDENRVPVIKKAEPMGGLKAYNRYLDNDARYPLSEAQKNVKGRVSLKFTVKTDGSLDEFKVVKSLGKLFDEEALRMVKEGPAWNPTTEDNVPVESEVLVRVKFDPAKAGR